MNTTNQTVNAPLVNDRLIRALLRQPVDQTPVWLMRQAGRYLPEYRALREKTPNFMEFCRTPELAAQATLQPLARYDLDAAIIFSDILVVPAAMGMDVQFIKGDGPHFSQPLRSAQDIERLHFPDIQAELGYVLTAIAQVKQALANRIPLIGFAGSPWTCATYMVEGGSSKTFEKIKTLSYREPKLLHQLLQRLTDVTIAYLNAQITAGVQVAMVFDTWGGVLSDANYPLFSLHYLQQIAQGIIRNHAGQTVPLIFFTKGGGQWLKKMAHSGCDALGLDWTTDIARARQEVGDQVALQGNLDPCCLFADAAQIEQQVQTILTAFGPGPGHVFNLGHGILPNTPPENVKILIDAVHRLSR